MISKLWRNCQSIVIDARGASRGIPIAWDPSLIDLNILSYTRNSLSSSLNILGTKCHGFLLNIYGPQTPTLKSNMILYMDWFKQQHSHVLVIFGGYFNMITFLNEKKRGRIMITTENLRFKSLIKDSKLMEPQNL